MPAVHDHGNAPKEPVVHVVETAPSASVKPVSKLKSHLLWPALALFIICALTTAALAATNALTAEPIAQQVALARDEARKAALSAATFEVVDLAALEASDPVAFATALGTAPKLVLAEASYGLDADGAKTGVVVLVNTRGYADGLSIMIGVALDGTVSGIRVLADNETPGLGKKVGDDAFLSGMQGKPTANGFAIRKSAVGDVVPVDAVTGATISSKAVVEAVNAAARLAGLLQKGGA